MIFIGKKIAAGIAGLALSVFGSYQSKAADINVDPSWSYTEINNILDNNPGTLGKGGQTDAQAGDTVRFAAGTYQLPQIVDASYRLMTDGVNLSGNNRN